jgi:hypothetical protein
MSEETKKILCGNSKCSHYRIHHERPDEMRPQRKVEVKREYSGKAFCSITCACLAGYYSITKGWLKDPTKG